MRRGDGIAFSASQPLMKSSPRSLTRLETGSGPAGHVGWGTRVPATHLAQRQREYMDGQSQRLRGKSWRPQVKPLPPEGWIGPGETCGPGVGDGGS